MKRAPFSLLASILSWLWLVPLILFLSSSPLALEMGILLSGILALLWTAWVFLFLLLLRKVYSFPQITPLAYNLIRSQLLAGALLLPLPLPWSAPLLMMLGSFLFYRSKEKEERAVRLEPIFLLAVGMKVLLVLLLLINGSL